MADIEMWVVVEYCAPEKCGRLSPPARHAHCVRPEQSKESGPAAPQTYGLPSWRCASAIAAPAPPFAAGAGPAGADGAALPPPTDGPPPTAGPPPPPPLTAWLLANAAAFCRAPALARTRAPPP